MSAYYFIYALVLCGVPISLIDDIKIRRLSQMLYFAFILTALALFAGLRSPYVDRDYLDYLDWFNSIATGTATAGDLMRDPAFGLISWLVASVGGRYLIVAVVYAVLGMLAMAYFSISAVSNRWSTLYFYLLFCEYFVIGELTEIRAMVAIPLMAVSLYLACSGEKKRAVLVYIVALAFHFSVIIALPFLALILMGVQFHSRWWILSLAPLTIIAIVALNRIIEYLLGLYRVSEAVNGGIPNTDYSRASLTALAHLLVIGASLLFAWKRLSLHRRVAAVCSGLGLSLLLIFVSSPGLSFRLLGVLDFYWLLLLVVLIELMQGRKRLVYLFCLVCLGYALYAKSLSSINSYSWTLGSH